MINLSKRIHIDFRFKTIISALDMINKNIWENMSENKQENIENYWEKDSLTL